MEPEMIQRIETRLKEDLLGNLMGLKFLTLKGVESDGGLWEDGSRWCSWFHYEPSRFWFDAKLYGDRRRIVYWNASDEGSARQGLAHLPQDSVVKVSTPGCRAAAGALWPRLNSFRWFTSGLVPPGPWPVEAFDAPGEDLLSLSEANGYNRDALAEQHTRGCRWFLARVEGVPRAICYVQPNYGPVWEVSGVLTQPEFRGRGLASSVVSAAVNSLVEQGHTPRYFVDDKNTASLAVARGLGMAERGWVEHFQTAS